MILWDVQDGLYRATCSSGGEFIIRRGSQIIYRDRYIFEYEPRAGLDVLDEHNLNQKFTDWLEDK